MAFQTTGLLTRVDSQNYSGTGNLLDTSGGGGGNLRNYGALFVSSPTPKHFLFNNNDDSMSWAGVADFKPSSTIAKGAGIWFNLNETNSTHTHTLMSRKASGNGLGWEFTIVNKNVVFKINTIGDTYTLSTTTQPITLTGWHYVFVKYQINNSATGIQIYVDGNLIISGNPFSMTTSTTDTYGGDLIVGYDITRGLAANLYPGKIAAAHVYKSDVTSTTAYDNYQAEYSVYAGTVNKTINETPATASALMTNENVSTTKNNTINETPATASLLMTNENVSTTKNKTIDETPGTASALFVNPNVIIQNPNVTVVAGTLVLSALMPNGEPSAGLNLEAAVSIFSIDYNPEPMILTGFGFESIENATLASARIIEPPFIGSPDAKIYQEGALSATAIINNAIPTFNSNYRHLIKSSNPSFYLGSYLQNKWTPVRDWPEDYYELKENSWPGEIRDKYTVWQQDSNTNWGLVKYENNVSRLNNQSGLEYIPFEVESSGFPMTAIGDGVSFAGPQLQFGDDIYDNFQPPTYADWECQYYGNDYNPWTFETWFKPKEQGAAIEWKLGAPIRIRLNHNSQTKSEIILKDKNNQNAAKLRSLQSGNLANRFLVQVIPGTYESKRFTVQLEEYSDLNGTSQLNYYPIATYLDCSMDPADPRYFINAVMNGMPYMFYNTVTGVWRIRPNNSYDPLYVAQANEDYYPNIEKSLLIEAFDLGSTSSIEQKALKPEENKFFTGGFTGDQPHVALVMTGDNNYNNYYSKKVGGINESPFLNDAWNHIVITTQYGNFGRIIGTSTVRNIRSNVWLNGSLLTTFTGFYRNVDTSEEGGNFIWVWGTEVFSNQLNNRNCLVDEVALYKRVLTNTEIYDHWSFINETSPNKIIEPGVFVASAYSAGGIGFAQSDKTVPATPITASNLIVDPTITAIINKNNVVATFTASAVLTVPSVSKDSINYADSFIASVYAPDNVYRIDTTYTSYLEQNFSLYRYINFDVPNSYSDLGTDADYSNAAPFSYNGYVNLPYQGLDNNSLVTPGSDVTLPDFIVKESEYNDDWGTTGVANQYHFNFWIKKIASDTSNYNRVVCSAQSHLYADDYFIIWQNNNYLKLTIKGDGFSQQTHTATLESDLFDTQRHNVVVHFDYTNDSGNVKIYVDKNLVLNTSLNNRKVRLLNGVSYVNPDLEANNKNRFAIGGTLVPDTFNKLGTVVYPSKLLIDCFYWSKTAITQEQLNTLWSKMPGRFDAEPQPDPFLTLSGVLVNPTFGAGVGNNDSARIVNAEIVSPSVSTQIYKQIIVSETLNVSSCVLPDPIVDPNSTLNKEIFADTFVASALIPVPTVIYTITATPLLASATMITEKPYLDPYALLIMSQSIRSFNSEASIFGGKYMTGDVDSE